MKTLKIENGKYYRSAGAVKVGPMSYNAGSRTYRGPGIYCMRNNMQRGDLCQVYYPDGSVFDMRPGEEDDHLVAEWTEEPKMQTGTTAQLDLQIGDRIKSYATASGGLVTDGAEYVIVRRENDRLFGKPDLGIFTRINNGIPLSKSHIWQVVSRAADNESEPGPVSDEMPSDHFDNDLDALPQTSKAAYQMIIKSLGEYIAGRVLKCDYEEALQCADLMRRAEILQQQNEKDLPK